MLGHELPWWSLILESIEYTVDTWRHEAVEFLDSLVRAGAGAVHGDANSVLTATAALMLQRIS